MKYGLFESFNEKNVVKSEMKGKYKGAWVEESFVFEKETDRQPIVISTGSFLGASISPKKIKIFILIFILGFLIVLGRLFYLQILKGDEYRYLAENNRVRFKPISAERGIFYDKFKKELVQNIPSFSLSIVPQDLPVEKEKRAQIIKQINKLSGVPEDDIYNLLKKYGNYSYESLVVKENLDYESALNLYIQNADLPGILIEKGTKRSYLTTGDKENKEFYSLSLSHILGYLGKLNPEELLEKRSLGYFSFDNIGKAGLEKAYETELRGVSGWKKIEVDSRGREQSVLAEEAPQPGKNLVLTVDLEAQRKMEGLIREYSEKHDNKNIAGLAMNPQDGSILAMVSWPSFDANDFSGGISYEKYNDYINDDSRPLFNRVIAGKYPSGSTIKMVISSAGLQEKIITGATTVLSTGGIDVGGHLFKDWRAGGHGTTNVIRAIAWSVNTFFYYVGGGYKDFEGLGLEKIREYMALFNIGDKTNIDLPGESSGFLPSAEWKEEIKNERWFTGDTYNLSIGQGDLLVTPLQVTVWTSAIVNGGKIITPHFLSQTEDSINKTIKKYEPKIIRENFVSQTNLNLVKQGMERCVTDGSCGLLQYLPFKTGGKTGTAQWSSVKETHAWFTSFAPANNPKIVVTILVEEGGEGGVAAMPIANEFLKWWGSKYLSTP